MERAGFLLKLADLIDSNSETLAQNRAEMENIFAEREVRPKCLLMTTPSP